MNRRQIISHFEPRLSKLFLCLLCFSWLIPSAFASAILSGRVTDSHGKPISAARVQIQTDNGRTTELVTDSRRAFRAEVNGKFHVDVQHDGYRTVRSSS